MNSATNGQGQGITEQNRQGHHSQAVTLLRVEMIGVIKQNTQLTGRAFKPRAIRKLKLNLPFCSNWYDLTHKKTLPTKKRNIGFKKTKETSKVAPRSKGDL